MNSIWIALWLVPHWYCPTPTQKTGVFLSSGAAQEFFDDKRIITYQVYEIQSEKWGRELVKESKRKEGKNGR